MKNIEWNAEEIKSIMDKFSKLGLGSMNLEDGDFKLKMDSKQAPSETVCHTQSVYAVASESASKLEIKEECVTGNVITSPIVGTFYASPSPEKPIFVKVGSKVNKGDVVFIIESMKLMNEIKSDFSGCVAEIYVDNGTPVEFGQPLMRIE